MFLGATLAANRLLLNVLVYGPGLGLIHRLTRERLPLMAKRAAGA